MGGKIGLAITTKNLQPVTTVPDYSYTRFFRVNILDPCGSPIHTGALDAWKVFFHATLDDCEVM
jgi:hypothetical protein